MTKDRLGPPKLQVVIQERRRIIMVPSEWAGDLRIYLKSKGVMSFPPQGVVSGLDSVELARGTDLASVQDVLDRWKECA